jgi:hypothetical protein
MGFLNRVSESGFNLFCYHGVCLPNNTPVGGKPARMFLSPRSPNAHARLHL